MSLNFNKDGRKLATIIGGKYNKKVVYVDGEPNDDSDDDKGRVFKSLKLNADSKFQQIPNTDTEREIMYITGASGSGKSTYIKNYVKQYKKAYPTAEIYIFSALDDDESIDELGGKRIMIDNSLYEDPIKVEEFAKSCVIFDDIDVISDKKIRGEVYNILNQILEIGRHHKISCCISNHLPTAGKDTKRVLNEAHSIVYFPHSGSLRGLKYLLTEYIGLDKNDIKKIKASKSRWCCIFKNYPQIAMTERMIYLLSNDDE